jgi:hypothetical protein
MNEIEIRRRLLTDPRRLSPEAQAAVEASPGLTRFRDELLQADEEMANALRRPEVPQGLADRIVLRARYGRTSRWGLALAASVTAIALALPWVLVEPRLSPMEQAMIQHVAQGADEWQDDSRIEPAVLRASVSALGLELGAASYPIRHLANCIVAGREGRHFVVDTPRGRVAFLVLPGSDEAGVDSILVRQGETRGVFMKRAGLTIGAFARDDASREALEKLMHEVFA